MTLFNKNVMFYYLLRFWAPFNFEHEKSNFLSTCKNVTYSKYMLYMYTSVKIILIICTFHRHDWG